MTIIISFDGIKWIAALWAESESGDTLELTGSGATPGEALRDLAVGIDLRQVVSAEAEGSSQGDNHES